MTAQDLEPIMEMQEIMLQEESWVQGQMESLTLTALDQDNTELGLHLEKEVLVLVRKQDREQALLEQLLDQEPIILEMEMTKEEPNLEMLLEMEETMFKILLDQGNIRVLTILEKKGLSKVLGGDILCP